MNSHEHMMGGRGVSRPMAEEALRDAGPHHETADADERETSGHGADGHGDGHGHHAMSASDRRALLESHHQQTLWVYWTLPLLGCLLLLAPFSFGYLNESLWVDPSGGRGPWFAESSTADLRQLRAWLITLSDVCAGVVLLVFGWRSLTPNRPISLWICCGVGVWLTLAPVLLWAPTAAAYVTDSLLGMLVIALTILIPGMPNMIMYMQHGPAQPPGWTYNPSSWPQRWIMIVTGFLGLVVSRYLAMFQLGYVQTSWDPFFGFVGGTEKVLNSSVSHMWPLSDAGLGAVSYTFEFLMGYMGSPSRWRTMPWMVAFFGFLVIPLGLTHIVLVVSQPLLVHGWCSMCLLAALIMLPMIPLEVDEVVAMFQHVAQAKRRGDRNGSLWLIFWKGGSAAGCTMDERSPALIDLPERPGGVLLSSIWGMSFPWTLVVSTVLGVILMFCPTWFGIDVATPAADIAHLGGALVVTCAVVCMGEVLRLGRYCNVPLGAGIAVGTWLVPASTGFAVTVTVLGLLVAVLALPRGRITESYGTWDRFVR